MADGPRRIYLLDASNYVYRAFHSTNPRDGGFSQSLSTSSGMPTNAILVFTNMLKKLVRDHQPTHFAAVFDPAKVRSFRYEQYAEYKANRKETPADLEVQFPYMRPIAAALGLTVVEKDGFEADDVIATLAARAVAEGYEAVIVSSDKDMYQLLSSKVRQYDGMKDRWIDLAAVQKKFGVDPPLVAEVQGLIGDSSDNIPGVPGVGPRTAAKLIGQYGDLEGIYENIESVKGKLKERLVEHREAAFLSRTLARLVLDCETDLALESLAVREPDAEALLPIFRELEFRSLVREYQKASRPVLEIARRTVTDADSLADLVAWLEGCETVAYEVLRDRKAYVRSELVGLGFASGAQSWYVPVGHRYLAAPPQLPLAEVVAALRSFFEGDGPLRRAYGSKEASVVLRRSGLDVGPVDLDVELLSYLANPTRYEHSLENMALDHLETRLPELSREIAKGRETWDQAPVEAGAEYSLARVEAVDALAPILWRELEEGELVELYRDLELPLGGVLATMEEIGVLVDPAVLRRLSARFGEQLTKLERTCHEAAGGPFNLGSPRQLADVLFNRLGLPVIKRTKTGPSTDASVLDQLREKHPLVEALLDWRSLAKLKGTYTDVLPTLVNPDTGRIHTNLRQTVTATGRLSSFDPNLQNIPIRTQEGRRIRDAFVPAPGCVLVSADYSQIELRVLAHLSDDPGLQAAFRDREDIHRKTAADVFEVPPAEVSFEQRSAAKAINFGLMYGMSAFRLARELHISKAQAQDWMDRYFERFSRVKGYMDGTIEFGRREGYVKTLLGRRRYVPELKSRNFSRRGAAERAAINAPVQGTAADLIKLAMLRVMEGLAELGLKSRMVLQVHDELLFDAPIGEVEALEAMVVTRMESVYPLSVPLEVSVASGANWNEAH